MRRPWVGTALASVATIGVALSLGLGCGGSSSLPEAAECASPTPTATPRAGRQFEGNQGYTQVVTNAAQQLTKMTNDFRARWPEGKFSSRPEFRQDFVNYQASASCLATNLRTFQPAGARYSAFDQRLDPVLTDYLAVFERGLEAVQKRNVTDYRAFNRSLDEVAVRLNEVLLTINQ